MTENDRILQEYSNPDNICIMKAACEKFKFLGEDELESCKLIALWKTIKNSNCRVKFTTSLYNHTTWQCRDRAKILLKNRVSISKNVRYSEGKHHFIDDIDEILAVEDGYLLIQKYLYNLTLKEIAQKNGLTIETARIKIDIAKNKLSNYTPE